MLCTDTEHLSLADQISELENLYAECLSADVDRRLLKVIHSKILRLREKAA